MFLIKHQNYPDLIASFNKLDLKVCSDEEIMEIIKYLGGMGLSAISIEKDRPIYRARPGQNKILIPQKMSYPPEPSKVKLGRANYAGQSIFYGSLPINEGDAYIIAAAETSYLMRNDLDGIETMTVGKWVAKEDIVVPVLASGKKCRSVSQVANNWDNTLTDFLANMGESNQKILAEYLSDLFAEKFPDGNQHKYRLTSAIANILYNVGYPGIAFPSAQVDGAGFNIALKPAIVDDVLSLEMVVRYQIEKKGKNIEFLQYETAKYNPYCFEYNHMDKTYWANIPFREDSIHYRS